MQKITKIMTDDESIFDTEKEARKYLDKKYGEHLTSVAHKILKHEKYEKLLEFLDENLNIFKELIELKNELNEGIENADD